MNLFGRSRNRGGGAESSGRETGGPQFFEVHCVEGHAIRGRRTEGYQALRCPDCGAGVFVLPRSPLPEPPEPPSRRRRSSLPMAKVANEDELVALQDPGWQASREGGEAPEDEIEWVDAPAEERVEPSKAEPLAAPAPEFDPDLALEEQAQREGGPGGPGRRARKAGARGPAGKARKGDAPELTTVARAADGMVYLEEKEELATRLRRHLPRLVFAGVAVLVLVTVAWSVRIQRRRDYPRLAEVGRTEGIEALEAGDFDRAHRLLSEAARAVEALRGEVGGAGDIVQAAQEAAILVDLVPVPLESILDERVRSADESEWSSTFRRMYEGRSVMIEARLVDPGPEGGRKLDYLILSQGPNAARVGRLAIDDLEVFHNINPKVGDLLQFGARLKSVDPDPGGEGWVFRLDPESGVLMSHAKALESLGWSPTPFHPDQEAAP